LKIKLDENLPERLVWELRQFGHDVDTVLAEQLAGQSDEHVWQATQSANRFLITQDLDFSDMRLYTPGRMQVCYWSVSLTLDGMHWCSGLPRFLPLSRLSSGKVAWLSQLTINCESNVQPKERSAAETAKAHMWPARVC
jgi:hypothetical protein